MNLVRDFYRREEALRQFVCKLARLPGARMLDVGCRRGEITQTLAEDKSWTAALDVARFPEWKQYPNLTFLRGDALALPFQDETFGVVVSGECLQYVRDWRRALDEMHRVLTPQGLLVLSCPGGHPVIQALEPYNLIIRTGRFLDWAIPHPKLRSWIRPKPSRHRQLVRHPPFSSVVTHRVSDWKCEMSTRRGSLVFIYASYVIDNLQLLRLAYRNGSRLRRWVSRGPLTWSIRFLFRVMRWDFALRWGPLSYNAIYCFRKTGP